MADPDAGSSSPEEDQDFDPTAEMMVHDYDDEQTLDEEEAMSNEDSMGNELDDLQKESEIPMEELLAMYGYKDMSHSKKNDVPSSLSLPDQYSTTVMLQNSQEDASRECIQDGVDPQTSVDVSSVNGEVENTVDSAGITTEGPFSTTDFLCSELIEGGSDDDEDYDPDQDQEDWKKSVPVGPEHQASVSESPVGADDNVLDQDRDDRILWSPYALNEIDVATYLAEVHKVNQVKSQGLTNIIPNGSLTRDDEQALYLLLQCDNNFEEALRRHKLQGVPPTDPMSLWTEEECRNFETGLRLYGKDFFLNQQNKVKSRSVREIVQFYYLWKKSERHDSFAARTRMEKKKYSLHPGITDYMDRFIYEFENPLMEAPTQIAGMSSNMPAVSSTITSLPFTQSTLLSTNLEGISPYCNNLTTISRTSNNCNLNAVTSSQLPNTQFLHCNSTSLTFPSSVCYDFSIASSSFSSSSTCGSSFVPHQQQRDIHSSSQCPVQSDFIVAPVATQVFVSSNLGNASVLSFPPSSTFYPSIDSGTSRNTNECSLGMMDVEGLISSSNIAVTDEPQELTITDINMIFGNVDKSTACTMHQNKNEVIVPSGDSSITSSDPTFLPESMQRLCSDDGIEPTLESISASIQELVDPDGGLSPENILSVLEAVPCCNVSTSMVIDAANRGAFSSKYSETYTDNGMLPSMINTSNTEPGLFHFDNLIVKEHVSIAVGSGDASNALNNLDQVPVEVKTSVLSKTDFDPNGCPDATVTS